MDFFGLFPLKNFLFIYGLLWILKCFSVRLIVLMFVQIRKGITNLMRLKFYEYFCFTLNDPAVLILVCSTPYTEINSSTNFKRITDIYFCWRFFFYDEALYGENSDHAQRHCHLPHQTERRGLTCVLWPIKMYSCLVKIVLNIRNKTIESLW